jgi:hypothetical protein
MLQPLANPTAASERRRARRAMPARGGQSVPLLGCSLLVVGYLVLCLALYRTTSWRGWLTFAVPAVLLIIYGVFDRVRRVLLLLEARTVLQSRGVRCLVVYSDSPTWQQRVQEVWLPKLGERAVTLNWSGRATWPRLLEVRLFKRFVDGWRNYNPAVLVFCGLRQPAVYRFYYAFQQAKHGRRQYLEALEAELFRTIGV